jgi:phospholipid/cholesterol/gamma-HCH transport system ATP-binding protein
MSDADPSPLLRVRDLAVGYGEVPVQRAVSFDVQRGSIFAIMGTSGCGKSTLLRALIGLLAPSAGSILFDGEDYWALSEDQRAQRGRRFGVLFQGGALWTSLTASQNVALPLQMFTGRSKPAIDALVAMKLSLVGLDTGRDSMPADLSGGMQRRVGLARALSLDPDILFLDEPSAGLDPISARHFDSLIRQLRDGFGVTVVMVSHELTSLFTTCDDGVFLDADSHTAIAHGAPRALRDGCPVPVVHSFMNPETAPAAPTAEQVAHDAR